MFESESLKSKRKPDLFFTSSGGKNRIAIIARALVKIKLDTRVIVDFDLLFEKEKTKELFEILGGDWKSIESDYDIIKTSIDQQAKPVPVNEICDSISAIIEEIKNVQSLSESHKEAIRSQIKSSNALRKAKQDGIDVIPAELKDQFNNLLLNFKKVGLWLVPFGELESFDKSTPGHSTAWVAKVLEKNILESEDLKKARDFVLDLSGINK